MKIFALLARAKIDGDAERHRSKQTELFIAFV